MAIRTLLYSGVLTGLLAASVVSAERVQVLHWWTSEGEDAAATVLRENLRSFGVQWEDRAIHGGAGESAMAVLKAQVIAGNPPDAAQIIGPNIRHWADLGYLQWLDSDDALWPGHLYQTIESLTRVDGRRAAVPVSIHRINWLWLNADVYRRLGLMPPTTWSQVFRDAETLREHGIIPLAHGGQPWQTATLFETLLLSVAGPEFYRAYFVDKRPEALSDDRVAEALQMLRDLKSLMDENVHNRQWQEATRMVHEGQAAMQVMGDWAKAELQALSGENGRDFLCMPVPGTAQNHLYSVDTFVFFQSADESQADGRQQFAQGILNAGTQVEFSRQKGTIPVRSDLDLGTLDDCAQTSAHVFREAETAGLLAPSVAHSMATSPIVEGAIFDALHRFFRDDSVTVAQTRDELSRILAMLRRHE